MHSASCYLSHGHSHAFSLCILRSDPFLSPFYFRMEAFLDSKCADINLVVNEKLKEVKVQLLHEENSKECCKVHDQDRERINELERNLGKCRYFP